MKVLLCLLLVIFSLIGISDAGFITYQKLRGIVPPCNKNFQCEQVLSSRWSSVGPVPLSVFGLGFYSLFFILSLCAYYDVQTIQLLGKQLPLEKVFVFLGISGASFSVYLVLLMGVVLHAWCLYCLLSATVCFILLILSTTNYLLFKKEQLI